jgi:tRNA A-37 threonylcarbamoyl transferase component Bud32
MTAPPGRLAAALADRYRIERELGQGGMATVYLAQDLKHDRQVAIKVLRPELAAVIGAERFLSEIKTTANLQHPHILPLFDSGAADSFLFYVMPFVTGESLRDRLRRDTQLPVGDAVRIATEVAGALDYAHRQGIIHRDIKPENILLHDGRALVADFGIALAASKAGGARMTETGMSLGTPHYMSPEQAMGEREITARSDVYALGCVTYEMLLGEPPFTGPTAQSIVAKVMTEKPASLIARRERIPPEVEDAVLTALEKLPADRPESARAFADGLVGATFPRQSGPRSATSFPHHRRWLVPALSIGCVLLAGSLAWAFPWGGRPAGPTVYDVGLPDSAAMWTMRGESFAVAPGGDFAIYQTVTNGTGELWYRSLLDATTRRVAGTENGWQPAISPDGRQVAFLREQDNDWTLETVPVTGGTSNTVGRGSGAAQLQWVPDGRLLVVELDGNHARWFDPGAGRTVSTPIPYCTTPASASAGQALICSGGFGKETRIVDGDRTTVFRTGAGDSTAVVGSQFRVIDGRYVAYLTLGGDLAAAPIDLASGLVGRSVRLVTGLGRREFSYHGTFGIAASGALVYALGENRALGYLVAASSTSLDTLPVGRAAFLRFHMSPDGSRLAAVVEGIDGDELRIYDLRTGTHQVWVRSDDIRQPLWSPAGDRVVFTMENALYVGAPDQAGPPEAIYRSRGELEAFAWMTDGRVVGVLWATFVAVGIHVDQRPVRVDTLLTSAGFVQPSPDGRWIAYNPPDLSSLWLEPLPRTGRRYQVAGSSPEDARWLSPSEFIYSQMGDVKSIHRARIVSSGGVPVIERRHWLDLPDFRETEGQSFQATPDGRVIYVRGAPESPVRYLRVVPNWVDQMKRAVDEANR